VPMDLQEEDPERTHCDPGTCLRSSETGRGQSDSLSWQNNSFGYAGSVQLVQ